MILTITLNPAVDIGYKLDSFTTNAVNRVNDVSKTAGGKGLNVARVLNELEEPVAVSGFLGGNLGEFIRQEVYKLNIKDFFVNISGETRNCIAMIHKGKQTEILESGPTITKDEATKFLKEFSEFAQKVKFITISGSLPKGLPKDYYVRLLEIADQHSTPVLLDTNGELLSTTLSKSIPFLIKPNKEELGDLLGEQLTSIEDILEGLNSSLFAEIPWVVVTIGEEGAIIKHHNNIYQITPPQIEVINPVGSGDAVIAGFAAGFSRNLSNEKLIRFAITMGVLNSMESKTGHINAGRIKSIMAQVELKKLL